MKKYSLKEIKEQEIKMLERYLDDAGRHNDKEGVKIYRRLIRVTKKKKGL